jgi:hypothetical protein
MPGLPLSPCRRFVAGAAMTAMLRGAAEHLTATIDRLWPRAAAHFAVAQGCAGPVVAATETVSDIDATNRLEYLPPATAGPRCTAIGRAGCATEAQGACGRERAAFLSSGGPAPPVPRPGLARVSRDIMGVLSVRRETGKE